MRGNHLPSIENMRFSGNERNVLCFWEICSLVSPDDALSKPKRINSAGDGTGTINADDARCIGNSDVFPIPGFHFGGKMLARILDNCFWIVVLENSVTRSVCFGELSGQPVKTRAAAVASATTAWRREREVCE